MINFKMKYFLKIIFLYYLLLKVIISRSNKFQCISFIIYEILEFIKNYLFFDYFFDFIRNEFIELESFHL